MMFPYKCPDCGWTTAQKDGLSGLCYVCKDWGNFTEFESIEISQLINENDIIAEIGSRVGNLVFYVNCSELELVYRYWYLIDAFIIPRHGFDKTQSIACNTICRQDVESAISQMSPVDLLILDAHENYAGAKNDFYAFCGIVKVGGKIVLHTYGDRSFWQFIDELKQTRQLDIKGNLVIVDWK